jgi:hypothetical protein
MTKQQNGHVSPVVLPDDSSLSIHPTRHLLQLRWEHTDRAMVAVREAFKSSSQHSGHIEMDGEAFIVARWAKGWSDFVHIHFRNFAGT